MPEELGEPSACLATDCIQRQAWSQATERLGRFGGRIVVVEQGKIATGSADLIQDLRAAHQSKNFEAHALAKADQPSGNRRVCGIDRYPVVRPQLDIYLEEQMRCGWIDTEHGKLPRVGV